MSTEITLSPAPSLQPAIFAPTPDASKRVAEFFTGQVNNDNTRRAYVNATRRFSQWCDSRGIHQLVEVQPIHVAAFIKELEKELSAPTVKQHLAALRMLFDWLVTGHIIEVNPAHAVRGPKYSTKKGKTPVLSAEETGTLFKAIDTASLVGLRDRALIGLMAYTFARVSAATSMKVEDCFLQGRRLFIQLHEKGGKRISLPCHHNLETYLEEYIAKAGIGDEKKGPLFRTAAGRSDTLRRNAMQQAEVYLMIQRRAAIAGITTRINCHTFRATGITTYLKNGGSIEVAQEIAGHESSRTTSLYDRRTDEISLDEISRIKY